MADQQIVIKRDADGKRYVQPYLGISKVTNRAIRPRKGFPADMTDDDFEALQAAIEEAQPDLEIDAHRGEQPLYPVVFSIE